MRLATMIVLLLVVTTAQAFAVDAIHIVPSLNVYDARGRWVGPVQGFGELTTSFHRVELSGSFSASNVPIVAIRVGAHTLLLRFFGSGGVAGNAPLFFESTDCTGPAYIDYTLLPMQEPVAMVQFVAYVRGVVQMTVNAQSTLNETQTCGEAAGEMVAWPAVPVADLSQRFTPPFTLR